MAIKEIFKAIMVDYIAKKTSNEDFRQIRELFNQLVNRFEKLSVVQQRQTVKVKYGVGIGAIANVPWISFLDTRETSSTRAGVYCCYLFRADMQGLYITFNQGIGRDAAKGPTVDDLEKVKKEAAELRPN